MDMQAAVSLVGRIRYKPGWCVTASHVPQCDVLKLCVGRTEPDCTYKGEEKDAPEIPINYTTTASREAVNAASESELLQWIFDVVVARELHEIEEWLRLDDKPFKEPHPEKGWRRGVLGQGDSLTLPRLPPDK